MIWYDTEHLPERQRVPGFLVCQRWIGAPDRKVSVATYDLDNVKVLKSPPYLAIGGARICRRGRSASPAGWTAECAFEGDQVLPWDQLPPDNAAAGCC